MHIHLKKKKSSSSAVLQINIITGGNYTYPHHFWPAVPLSQDINGPFKSLTLRSLVYSVKKREILVDIILVEKETSSFDLDCPPEEDPRMNDYNYNKSKRDQ